VIIVSTEELMQFGQEQKSKQKRKTFTIIIAWIGFFALGLWYLDIAVSELFTAIPEFLVFFVTRFFPPDFNNIQRVLPDLLQTVSFALVATVIASIIALILAFMMAENLNAPKPVRLFIRAIVSLSRNIPVVIWGTVLVYIFGIGAMVGIIALNISLIGFLTKSYADAIDEIPAHALEGLKANGATHLQILFHGVIPQFVPSWLNWTLYAFEIGVRASSILGLVGAGGIGVLIQTRISLFQYQEAFSIVLCVIALVLIVEFITGKIRGRIQ